MSKHLPSMRPAQVLKALQRAGFYVHHVKGSHYYLKHSEQAGLRVTLPFHGTDLKRRTLISIIESAGFTVEEFLDIL